MQTRHRPRVGRVGWSSGRAAQATGTSFVVLRRALAESPLVRVLLNLLLDGDVLLLDLLDVDAGASGSPSRRRRTPFRYPRASLAATRVQPRAPRGEQRWWLREYSLLLSAFVCMVAHPCGVKSHGSAHLASVCISSHQSARASSLTWLVRVEPCQSRESLAYMPRDSCATLPACASAPVHVQAHIHMHIQVFNWLHVIACGCLWVLVLSGRLWSLLVPCGCLD